METIVDLHCHPSLKPFGWAYPLKNKNDKDPSKRNSIWHPDFPTQKDIKRNRRLGVTKFSQANFTALYKGQIRVVIVALNPPEKQFFLNKPGKGSIGDKVCNFVTEFGKEMIDYIQKNNDYFTELKNEYKFYKQLNRKKISVEGNKLKYKLTRNFDDVFRNQNNPKAISVIFSIEGGHAFNEHYDLPPDKSKFISNINKVKQWQYPPFFVTIAHHFRNGLGGHAKSLSDLVSKFVDQSEELDDDLKTLGLKVIQSLRAQTMVKGYTLTSSMPAGI